MASDGPGAMAGKPPATPGSVTGSQPPGSARRDRLENIRQREAVKDQLVIKLRDRFSRTADDAASVGSAAINREVDKFIGKSARMTEANLARLERRLQRQAQGKPVNDGDTESLGDSISAYTLGSAALSAGGSNPSQRLQPLAQPLTARGPGALQHVSWKHSDSQPMVSTGSAPASARGSARGSAKGSGKGTAGRGGGGTPRTPSAGSRGVIGGVGDAAYQSSPGSQSVALPAVEWAVLDKLAADQLEQDAVRQREREQELQMRLRKDLDRQVADTRMKLERDRQADQIYHEMQVEAYHQHCEQEHNKELVRQQKLNVQKHERNAQMELLNAKREEEKLREMQEAQSMKERILREEQEEKRKKEDNMRQQKEMTQKALDLGSEAHQKREEERQRLQQLENQCVEDYRRKQEARENVAKEAKQKAAEVKSAREGHAATLAASQKRRSDVATSRTAAEALEKERQAVELEKANKERLEALRKENKEYLFSQMKAKENKKKEEEERRRALRRTLELDTRKFKEDEQKRELEKAKRNEEHKAILEQQIAKRMIQGPKREVMSECEMRLNRPLLDRIGCKPLALADVPMGSASVAC